jgi:thioredoxin 1
MSENTDATDDLDAIRRRKRERMRAEGTSSTTSDRSAESTSGGADAAASDDDARTPTEPVAVDGTDAFDALLDRYDVVLADFSATWCGPCQVLEPIVERVADRSPGAVASIDIDANPDLARKYSVRSVPTLLLFVDGDPVERLVGVQDEAVLTDLVAQHAD